MNTSAAELIVPTAIAVSVTDDALVIGLSDGRTVTLPLTWYPRLLHGTSEECANWRLIGNGIGIHWPDLDEDISVESILRGKPSMEAPASLKKWLDGRG